MFDGVIRWLYNRAGSRYWLVMVAAQAGVSIFVVLLTVAVIVSYYDSTVADYAWIAGPRVRAHRARGDVGDAEGDAGVRRDRELGRLPRRRLPRRP